MARKRICVLTVFPEGEYQQKLLPGIFSQCKKYDYDVAVVTPLVQVCSTNRDYLNGELNIFELVNFDLFDGVIVTPIPLSENSTSFVVNRLLEKMKNECHVPVVSIDMEFGDYPTVYTDDTDAFFHITEHLILQHGCKDIVVLGAENSRSIVERRYEGIFKAAKKYNLKIDEEKIFNGNFWYDSGEDLANRFVVGELPLPDAVICLSDYMAIGLTNYLIKHGINVPKDVIVTGYDAIFDASTNTPPITTYASDVAYTASLAVNLLHKKLNPQQKETKCKSAGKENLCIGGTCGCPEDVKFTRERLKNSQMGLRTTQFEIHNLQKVSMGMLVESYMMENLTEAITPFDCLAKIYEYRYLIRPFGDFYICLNEDWLNTGLNICEGYSKKMQISLASRRGEELLSTRKHVFSDDEDVRYFDTALMLPEMIDSIYTIPQVYYFVPIHFGTVCFGYAVVQNDLENPGELGMVFRNFLRNVNNALEMTRVKYQTSYLSEHDIMTDLYNRRGMRRFMAEKYKNADDDDVLFAIVIDMDGLKKRNDNYGHLEGDNGIIYISEAVKTITDAGEIAARGGGDEFFVFGAGDYDETKIREKFDRFGYYLETLNEKLEIPVSASFGYSFSKKKDCNGFVEVMEKADSKMYQSKFEKKKKESESKK